MSEQHEEGSAPAPEVRAAGVVHEIPSLCMNCHDEGMTRLLVTAIPFFKEILVSSFQCDHCHHKDTSVTSAADLGEGHTTYTLNVDVISQSEEEIRRNMSRTVMRSESARILIPELEFEIPPKRAEINTVEGMLMNIRESLVAGQEERKTMQPEIYEKIENVIQSLEMMQEGRENFTFIVEDAAGNSFLSNPDAPKPDAYCTVVTRPRKREETIALGFSPDDPLLAQQSGKTIISKEEREALIQKAVEDIKRREQSRGDLAPERGEQYKSGGSKAALKAMSQALLDKQDLDFDALVEQKELQSAVFHDICYECGRANETRMCVVDIPYFRETIIMCTDCVHCGYKNTEIKAGGGIADKGCKIELQVKTHDDLSRDVLKSDYSSVRIPALEIDMAHGTLGGKFSTVEGLLLDVKNQLHGARGYYEGDSAMAQQKAEYEALLKRLDDIIEVREPFTFVIDDPSGGSFVEGRVNGVHDTDPNEDEQLAIEYYTRTSEQDEELGIKDMVTEDYYDGPTDTVVEEKDEDDEDEDKEE